MKKWIFLCLLLPLLTFGQKEMATWYFGTAGLDFNCSPVKAIEPGNQFQPMEGCSSISDASGNLLFYTDGSQVYDKTHQVMENGSGIGSDPSWYGSSTQGALIVKQPLQNALYYIFTTDCAENKLEDGFSYSIVDMSLNDGKGAVTLKKQQLLPKTCEKLCAVRHTNGVDTWILTHEWGNANFDAYLLTAAGLTVTPVVSVTGRIQLPADMTDAFPAFPYPEAASRGHMKFSPQGNKLVVLSASDGHPDEFHAELFSFNASTGTVDFDFSITTSDTAAYYGASFSPDGNLLYLSAGWYGRYIHQYNLTAYDSVSVANSKYVVFSDPDFTQNAGSPSALQIGPDGKIYCASNFFSLNVINNPNQYGAGCNFQINADYLLLDDCVYNSSVFGLPNNDESYYLNTFTGNTCNDVTVIDFVVEDSCAGSISRFFDISSIYPLSIDSWYWDFGDPASGPNNFSQLMNPEHIFTSPGTYEVKLTVFGGPSNTCRVDSVVQNVKITCTLDTWEQAFLDGEIQLYPNPATHLLHIESPVTIQQLLIYDAQGSLVYADNKPFKSTDLVLDLADGMYVVECYSDKVIRRKKIVLAQR